MHASESTRIKRSDLIIRPATEADRPALEAIAAEVWDGDDYLPRVLDTWLNDPYDGFFVACVQDTVVGLGKLTRLDAGEWWLEGLRVAKPYRGRGISRILHHFLLNQLRQLGQGTVRFSTPSTNEPVHVVAAETGFERVASFRLYAAGPLAQPVAHLRPLDVDDLALVQDWLAASAHFLRMQRSMDWDWKWYLVTDARLRQRLADGLVYGWCPDGGCGVLSGLVIVNPSAGSYDTPPDELSVAYYDALLDDLPALAQDLRRVAASLGRVKVQLRVLDRPEQLAAFEQAGYGDDWEGHAMWLFSREVSLTRHTPVRVDTLPPPPDV